VKFLGGTYAQIPEIYRQASPVTWVSADDPPLLLVHGDRDTVVLLRQSVIMHQAYEEAGLEATLVAVNNGTHGLVQQPNQPAMSPSYREIILGVIDFFTRELVKPA